MVRNELGCMNKFKKMKEKENKKERLMSMYRDEEIVNIFAVIKYNFCMKKIFVYNVHLFSKILGLQNRVLNNYEIFEGAT